MTLCCVPYAADDCVSELQRVAKRNSAAAIQLSRRVAPRRLLLPRSRGGGDARFPGRPPGGAGRGARGRRVRRRVLRGPALRAVHAARPRHLQSGRSAAPPRRAAVRLLPGATRRPVLPPAGPVGRPAAAARLRRRRQELAEADVVRRERCVVRDPDSRRRRRR